MSKGSLFASDLGLRRGLCSLNFEEALANDICSVLQSEDHNRVAEFVVKDVQLIQAKVKADSIKESQTIYRCAVNLISLFNMTTM
ncbi:hypothetical protein QQP08_008829 [Theobroma cacao]|nr:hypothetical protein QQP08_008829 [Theobroma cacao]